MSFPKKRDSFDGREERRRKLGRQIVEMEMIGKFNLFDEGA